MLITFEADSMDFFEASRRSLIRRFGAGYCDLHEYLLAASLGIILGQLLAFGFGLGILKIAFTVIFLVVYFFLYLLFKKWTVENRLRRLIKNQIGDVPRVPVEAEINELGVTLKVAGELTFHDWNRIEDFENASDFFFFFLAKKASPRIPYHLNRLPESFLIWNMTEFSPASGLSGYTATILHPCFAIRKSVFPDPEKQEQFLKEVHANLKPWTDQNSAQG